MEVDRRVVVGTFDNENAAATEVRRLIDEGYPENKITLYTNADKVDALRASQDVDVKTEGAAEESRAGEDDRSFWEQIKDAFSMDTYDYDDASQHPEYTRDDDVLYPYRDDIAAGKIVIVVEDFREDADTDETATMGTGTVTDTTITDTDREPDMDLNRTDATVGDFDRDSDLTEEERIRLREERLEVDKEEVQTGEVNIRKETKHETKSIDVPVEKEEVIIERKPVAGADSEATDMDIDEETESFSIPIKEEKVEVRKKPVVTEEVEIRKERHEEVEEVTEDVRREELEVDRDDETNVTDSDRTIDLDRTDRVETDPMDPDTVDSDPLNEDGDLPYTMDRDLDDPNTRANDRDRRTDL